MSNPEADLIQMLIDDNKRLRNAGCKLSEAAFKVATEYDGVHRLMLAVSEWAKAIANEGGREKVHNTTAQGDGEYPSTGINGRECNNTCPAWVSRPLCCDECKLNKPTAICNDAAQEEAV